MPQATRNTTPVHLLALRERWIDEGGKLDDAELAEALKLDVEAAEVNYALQQPEQPDFVPLRIQIDDLDRDLAHLLGIDGSVSDDLVTHQREELFRLRTQTLYEGLVLDALVRAAAIAISQDRSSFDSKPWSLTNETSALVEELEKKGAVVFGQLDPAQLVITGIPGGDPLAVLDVMLATAGARIESRDNRRGSNNDLLRSLMRDGGVSRAVGLAAERAIRSFRQSAKLVDDDPDFWFEDNGKWRTFSSDGLYQAPNGKETALLEVKTGEASSKETQRRGYELAERGEILLELKTERLKSLFGPGHLVEIGGKQRRLAQLPPSEVVAAYVRLPTFGVDPLAGTLGLVESARNFLRSDAKRWNERCRIVDALTSVGVLKVVQNQLLAQRGADADLQRVNQMGKRLTKSLVGYRASLQSQLNRSLGAKDLRERWSAHGDRRVYFVDLSAHPAAVTELKSVAGALVLRIKEDARFAASRHFQEILAMHAFGAPADALLQRCVRLATGHSSLVPERDLKLTDLSAAVAQWMSLSDAPVEGGTVGQHREAGRKRALLADIAAVEAFEISRLLSPGSELIPHLGEPPPVPLVHTALNDASTRAVIEAAREIVFPVREYLERLPLAQNTGLLDPLTLQDIRRFQLYTWGAAALLVRSEEEGSQNVVFSRPDNQDDKLPTQIDVAWFAARMALVAEQPIAKERSNHRSGLDTGL